MRTITQIFHQHSFGLAARAGDEKWGQGMAQNVTCCIVIATSVLTKSHDFDMDFQYIWSANRDPTAMFDHQLRLSYWWSVKTLLVAYLGNKLNTCFPTSNIF